MTADLRALRERLIMCRLHAYETEEGNCFLVPLTLVTDLDDAFAALEQEQAKGGDANESGTMAANSSRCDPANAVAGERASAQHAHDQSAKVAEQVDATDLKSVPAMGAGSTPALGTISTATPSMVQVESSQEDAGGSAADPSPATVMHTSGFWAGMSMPAPAAAESSLVAKLAAVQAERDEARRLIRLCLPEIKYLRLATPGEYDQLIDDMQAAIDAARARSEQEKRE